MSECPQLSGCELELDECHWCRPLTTITGQTGGQWEFHHSIESTSNDTTQNLECLIAQQCNFTNVDILTVGYVPKYLDFSRNKLSWFPNFTQSISRIIELNLYYNHIRKVPGNLLSTLTQMTKLILSKNDLHMFPIPPQPLDSILHLYHTDNSISTIERSSICLYPNLRSILLQSNILSSLPDINFLFHKKS